jgi:2-polyprenyl-3-methyl-5-hydroxy-6-metoxy-1,4-benzoquinol methylase
MGLDNPKITISMSYYGTGDKILESVKSILNQSFRDFRLVILNDGGDTNKVWDPLRGIDDPRVVRFDIRKNSGTYFAHAISLLSCNTEFWLPHDSDDISRLDRLEKLLSKSANQDVVFNKYNKINVDGSKLPSKSFPHWSALYRTKFLKSIGGINPSRRVGFDSTLIHLCKVLGKTTQIEEELYSYILRPNSLTVNDNTNIKSLIRQDAIEYERTMIKEVEKPEMATAERIRRIIESQIPFDVKQEVSVLSADLSELILRSNTQKSDVITSKVNAVATPCKPSAEEKPRFLEEKPKKANEDYNESLFWEQRYASGGNSGSGSEGTEAEWKVKELSRLITKHKIKSVLDVGSGDGRIARAVMSRHPDVTYVGIDISPTAVASCSASALPNMKFIVSDCVESEIPQADMVMCVDVLTHISTQSRQQALEKKIRQSSLKCSFITNWNWSTIFNDHSVKAKHVFVRPYVPKSLMNTEVKSVDTNPKKVAFIETNSTNENPIIASLASISSRVVSLEKVVNSLKSQVDKLCVYLNGYSSMPGFLDGCVVARSQDHGNKGDAGKLFWCEQFDKGNFRVLVDDDIHYPPNYVNYLISKATQYGKKSVVGLHGVQITGNSNYYKQRNVLHFAKELGKDTHVHLLGSGTIGYFDGSIDVKLSDFPVPNMADVWFAKLGQQQKVPFIAVARSEMWCWEFPGTGNDSIYAAAKTNAKNSKNTSEEQNRVVKELWPWKIHK